MVVVLRRNEEDLDGQFSSSISDKALCDALASSQDGNALTEQEKGALRQKGEAAAITMVNNWGADKEARTTEPERMLMRLDQYVEDMRRAVYGFFNTL